MKKPFKMNYSSGIIHSNFGNLHIVQGPQPDWEQDNTEAPDYIKNKDAAEQYRPVSINGEQVLDESRESGNLNLVSGENVTITKGEDNEIIISSTGGGGGGDGTAYVEGNGIDFQEVEGKKAISIQADENFEFKDGSLTIKEEAIDDSEIKSVSIDKIVPKEGFTLILNGGNANG